jgi:polysaccharide pyruvyl transferase WcaK-like protein
VPSDKGRAEFLLGRIFKRERPPFFVVAMKGDAEVALRIRVASELKRERERGREILFAVMCELEDRRISEEMARAVGGVVLGGVCLADLCAILGYAEGVCSMRLHALIAGSIAGCPIYPIGTDEKILRYCREIR